MNYRTNPKTGAKVSLLGFGMMRLPIIGDQHDKIDEEKAIAMTRYAIDHGVNYLDTAHVYHGGMSEVVTGKVLKDGYHDKATVATKLPFGGAKEASDLQKAFDISLERLGTGYIDYYLAHDINDDSYEKFTSLNVYDFLKEKKAEGKVKNIGFSYHGNTTEFFKKLLDTYDWDFVQIQFNYMDRNIQAGVEGLKYAASKGIPVIVMEPCKGGKITQNLPDEITSKWENAKTLRSPAEWAFRWVADFPEVMCILSGMSTQEQVEENVVILDNAEANSLSPEEHALIDDVAKVFDKMMTYGCTACRYCLPCPVGIDIPKIIGLRNEATMFDCVADTAGFVTALINPKPSACIACKNCEEACPQHLLVSDIMKESAEMLELPPK